MILKPPIVTNNQFDGDLMDSSSSGRVVAVSLSPAHTFRKENRSVIHVVKGLGIEGDAHSGETVKHRSHVARDPTRPNLRQVHLIHQELHDELKSKGFEVGPGILGENILCRGLDLLSLPRNTVLRIGDEVQVLVTGLRNPCKQLEDDQTGLLSAVLGRDAEGRLIRKSGIMGVVLNGGPVRPDDVIKVVQPPEPHEKLEPV